LALPDQLQVGRQQGRVHPVLDDPGCVELEQVHLPPGDQSTGSENPEELASMDARHGPCHRQTVALGSNRLIVNGQVVERIPGHLSVLAEVVRPHTVATGPVIPEPGREHRVNIGVARPRLPQPLVGPKGAAELGWNGHWTTSIT
jgi:hypothetical protein